jgi:chorismate dehydratase
MSREIIRVAAVSYTNTIPFIYGLTRYPGIRAKISLDLMPPADCATAWHEGRADIALVPVGALKPEDLDSVCCHWCLGAEGSVESVLLLSNSPLDLIQTIYLDSESRTSVLLAEILCRFHWHIHPEMRKWKSGAGMELSSGEALLLIGDKTFGIKDHFSYVFDLAEAWINFTHLPMVFACWLTSPDVADQTRNLFEKSLAWGVAHIPEAISYAKNLPITTYQVQHYLTTCISYHFGKLQMDAVRRFFSLRDAL